MNNNQLDALAAMLTNAAARACIAENITPDFTIAIAYTDPESGVGNQTVLIMSNEIRGMMLAIAGVKGTAISADTPVDAPVAGLDVYGVQTPTVQGTTISRPVSGAMPGPAVGNASAPVRDDFEDITNMPMDGPPVNSVHPSAAAGSGSAEEKPVLFTSEDPLVESFYSEQQGLDADEQESTLPDVPAGEGVPPADESRINR